MGCQKKEAMTYAFGECLSLAYEYDIALNKVCVQRLYRRQ